jgi:hypothetical protein
MLHTNKHWLGRSNPYCGIRIATDSILTTPEIEAN